MSFLLDNIVLVATAVVSGALLLWPKLSKGGGQTAVSAFEATQLINHRNAIVVDVRDEAAFAAGSLAGARNVPNAQLAERVADLARFKARPVVVVCGAGQQSAKALAAFKAQGFEETYSLAGGIDAWKQASLPLVQPGRDAARPVAKEPGRRQKGRMAKNAPPPPAAESVVEPAGALTASAAPLPDAVAAAEDTAAAKAV